MNHRWSKITYQEGAATLVTSLVLLFAITLITLFSSRATLMETRISANEYRDKQAFEAAEAGLKHAMAYVASTGGPDKNSDGAIDNITPDSLDNSASYTISTVDISPGSNMTRLEITSTGFSDDSTAKHVVSVITGALPFIRVPPTVPLTAKGDVGLKGNSSVNNPEGNSTIRTGGNVSITGSAITQVSNGAGGLTGASNSGTTGPDITTNDIALASLTAPQYFEYFFGDTYANIRATADINTSPGAGGQIDTIVNGVIGQTIWINGDAKLTGTTTIGSLAKPVILIVYGDLLVTGNCTIYGLVYTINKLNNLGTMNITGAAIVQNNYEGNGNMNITFNSSLGRGPATIENNAVLAGSWKDF